MRTLCGSHIRAGQVEAMAGWGISSKDIALVLGIAQADLERDYRQELESGVIRAAS